MQTDYSKINQYIFNVTTIIVKAARQHRVISTLNPEFRFQPWVLKYRMTLPATNSAYIKLQTLTFYYFVMRRELQPVSSLIFGLYITVSYWYSLSNAKTSNRATRASSLETELGEEPLVLAAVVSLLEQLLDGL